MMLVTVSLEQQVVIVKVGGAAGLVYNPNNTVVQVGDTVMFQFGLLNHTVTQMTDATGCVRMVGGFNSGKQVSPNALSMTAAAPGTMFYGCTVKVNNTSHCLKGMRGVIRVSETVAVNPCPAGFVPATSQTTASHTASPGVGVARGYLSVSKRDSSVVCVPSPTGSTANSTVNSATSDKFFICLFIVPLVITAGLI